MSGHSEDKRNCVRMALTPSHLEEDLTCPVCQDIFRDPVILNCSHSFCRDCLQGRWGIHLRECPVCQRKSSAELQPNLALHAVCDRLRRSQRSLRPKLGSSTFCSLHGDALKFFCLDDKAPICADCLTEAHMDHKFIPLEKAVTQCKEELKTALRPLQEKLDAFNKVKQTFDQTAEFIKIQTQQTEGQIKEEFEKLHQFLRQEEAARIAALREEEELKSQMMNERIEKIKRQISFLTNMIGALQQEVKSDDISFLQNYKDAMRRAQYKVVDPETKIGALIDVAKHLGNLKYRVWEKMLKIIPYIPVTLDPNTAHSHLSVLKDLSSVKGSRKQQVPNNPERFSQNECVLGAEGFSSGRHHWDVDVGGIAFWRLGAVSESVNRKAEITLSAEAGVWGIRLQHGKYTTLTPSKTPIDVKRDPQRVRVQLDWNKGEITFSDPTDGTLLYTFKHRFTERIFPVFFLGSESVCLKVCPLRVSVTVT